MIRVTGEEFSFLKMSMISVIIEEKGWQKLKSGNKADSLKINERGEK
jgi:hypothetical protein